MSGAELLLLGTAGAGILYFMKRSTSDGRSMDIADEAHEFAQAHQIEDLQHRHLMVGLATGKGHSGANRYMSTGAYMHILPNQDMEHFSSFRGTASHQWYEGMGAGEWMKMS